VSNSSNDLERGDDPTKVHQEAPHPTTLKLTGDPELRKKLKNEIENFLTHHPKKRQDGIWPYLLIRAYTGDFGVRQPPPAVFWQSPDIIVIQGDVQTLEGNAPTLHPIPNKPHTIFVRVWNLGRLPAIGIRLRVYWANPSFSFDDPTGPGSPHFIGGTYVNLSSRYQPGSHLVSRVPVLWVPVVENNGHECLLAKVDCFADRTGPGFDANTDRHVGQRNVLLADPQEDLSPLIVSLGSSLTSQSDVQILVGSEEHPESIIIKNSLIGHEGSLAKAIMTQMSISDLKAKTLFSRLNTNTLRIQSIQVTNVLGGYTIMLKS
jgi:hypothetical protein